MSTDGRWWTLGALTGLAAASAVRGGSAAKKKPVLSPEEMAAKLLGKTAPKQVRSQGLPFPVPGIAGRSIGPLSIVVYEKESDLKTAATDVYKNSQGRIEAGARASEVAILPPGGTVPAKLPTGAHAAYGPEIQTHVWELDEFPGWLVFNIDPVGGIGGGPPSPGAPKRVADQSLSYILVHVPSGEIKNWAEDASDLLSIVILTEAAAPGYGRKKVADLTTSEKSLIVAKDAAIAAPDNLKNRDEVQQRWMETITSSILDVWRQEGQILPPIAWRLTNFVPRSRTFSFAYALPGDPWAASWEWPASAQAQAKGAVRRRLRRSRVPGNRKAEVTLEGVLDKTSGFQWKIRGAFEYFGRDEAGQIVLDSTGGFSDQGWGQTGDDDKGLMLFQTGAGWKAAVGFGWTFMRLIALLGGDRMDDAAIQVRAAIRKTLFGKGKAAWRAWYELAFGDRKQETAVAQQQHEIRSSAAREARATGWVSRSDARRQAMSFPVTIPAYEDALEGLAAEAATSLGFSLEEVLEQQAAAQQVSSLDAEGRIREKVKAQKQAHAKSRFADLPFDTEARVRRLQKVAKRAAHKPIPRAEISARVVAMGPLGVLEAMAVRYGKDPIWHLLDEDGEPVKALGTERPTPAQLRALIR